MEGGDDKGYGQHLQGHRLEQYKLFVGTCEAISDRRLSASKFFLSANSALLVSYGVLLKVGSGSDHGWWAIALSMTGLVLCWSWFRLLTAYEKLNKAKFKLIHEIEQGLPIALFDREWTHLGRGRDPSLYLSLSRVEREAPIALGALHLLAGGWIGGGWGLLMGLVVMSFTFGLAKNKSWL